MKKKTLKGLGIAFVSFSAFVLSGWSFFEMIIHCKTKKRQTKKKWFNLSHTQINHPRHKFENEYEKGKAWCQNRSMRDCYIKSDDDLSLHARFLPAKGAKRFVILCHGYKGSGFGDFANIARFLHEHGCHLLFIDERCCGESEGEFITFGAREKYDIQRWAYFVAKRNKKKLPIYLYGESMGAASVLMASGLSLPDDVRGLISDCGFNSMKAELRYIASNWFHIRFVELLLFRVNILCKWLGGFSMKEADTTESLRRNTRPVLFFHGEADTYVSPKGTKYNYKICRAKKELVLVPDARHLCSAYEKPELYREKLLEFFKKYDIL